MRAQRLSGGAGDDTLDGGAATTRWTAGRHDTASMPRGSGVTVSLAVRRAQNTVGAGSDTLTGIENLTGSSFNDVLTGDAGATC
jgi:Ca2+-binding RTX toxin-like protein